MLKLEDLKPEPAEFTLAATGHTYKLHRVSIEDEIWLRQTFGDKIEKIFKDLRMPEICRIAFHLMEEESKQDFAKREVTVTTEMGDSEKITIGGYKALYACVSGMQEKLQIVEAVFTTIGLSRPVLEALSKEDSEKKTPLTGQKSSTSSPQSTDGQPNTSSPSL